MYKGKTAFRSFRGGLGIIGLSVFCVFSLLFSCSSVVAVSKPSTLSIDVQSSSLGITLYPSNGGSFAESSNATILVGTDNFTGYSLSISTAGNGSLVNENDDEIESISSAISASTFSTDSNYNNKWGFKPSQYVTTVNNNDIVVQNSNFLPAPSGQGLLIARSTSANSIVNNEITTDTYTFSFGARADNTLPAGTYTATYVISAVANSIVYNVTYNENTTGTVTSMPYPNPQALEIDGGTPITESYGILSNAVPVLADMSFGGWCDVATTVDPVTHNYECSGTTYQPGAQFPIDQTVELFLFGVAFKNNDHGNTSGVKFCGTVQKKRASQQICCETLGRI